MSTTKPVDVHEKKPKAVHHSKHDDFHDNAPGALVLPAEVTGDPAAVKPVQPSPRVEGDPTPLFDPSVRPARAPGPIEAAKLAANASTHPNDLLALWRSIDDMVARGGDSYATRVAIQASAREVLSRLLGEVDSNVVDGKLVTIAKQ